MIFIFHGVDSQALDKNISGPESWQEAYKSLTRVIVSSDTEKEFTIANFLKTMISLIFKLRMKHLLFFLLLLFVFPYLCIRLCWVFVAAPGLSLVVASGVYSSL